jgi:hypothetical protein
VWSGCAEVRRLDRIGAGRDIDHSAEGRRAGNHCAVREGDRAVDWLDVGLVGDGCDRRLQSGPVDRRHRVHRARTKQRPYQRERVGAGAGHGADGRLDVDAEARLRWHEIERLFAVGHPDSNRRVCHSGQVGGKLGLGL